MSDRVVKPAGKECRERDARDPSFCLLCDKPPAIGSLCKRHHAYYWPDCPLCGVTLTTDLARKRDACTVCWHTRHPIGSEQRRRRRRVRRKLRGAEKGRSSKERARA